MLAASRKLAIVCAIGGVALTPAVSRAQATGGRPLAVVQTPTGWFGVMISDQALLNESGAAFFDRYPVVTHVEEGSPAEKAGVRPGDVLMTFNSHDMRGSAFEMSNWLKPGARFVVRLRRNDKIKTVKGVLKPRPSDWTQRVTVEVSPMDEPGIRSDQGAPSGGMRSVYFKSAKTPAPPRLPSVLVPALGLGRGVYPFAGAEFTAMNDDLSEVLGVREDGVFVTNVVAGSLARNSGLRGGDVVVMADTIRIQNPSDLVRAIRNANDESLRLQVIRRHRPQTITLRWSPRD